MHEPTIDYYEANAQRFFKDTRDVDIDHLYRPFLSRLPKSGARILDAGCGPGRDSLAFLERGHEIVAFDGSKAMVRLATRHTGLPVRRISFDQVEFDGSFHGVWACASLLHVPYSDMEDVLWRLARALKPSGVLYASFRCGDGETVRGGRLFTDYHEESFLELLEARQELRPIEIWRTTDARIGRSDVVWLNVLLRKVAG